MILPDGPRLTLDELSTELELVGLREDAHGRRRELDRLARERLPEELGRVLEGSLGSGDAVIRIRRLELELDLAGSELTPGRLAAAWSRRLARVLREELRKGPGPNLAVFESHADFMAAYVELLVRGGSPHPWAFRDFHALEHLDAADAVVELLSLRPGALVAVARRLARSRSPDGLLLLLGEERIRRLLEAAAGDGPRDAWPTGAVEALQAAGLPLPAGPGPFARGLGLLLRSLAAQEPAGRGMAERAAAVLELARAGEEVTGWSPEERRDLAALLRGDPAAAPGTVRRDAVAPLLELLEGDRAPLRLVGAFLLPREAGEPERVEEPEEAPGASERSPAEAVEPSAEEPRTEGDGEPAAIRTFRSSFAGLALLVPVVRALELHEHLGPIRLRALLREAAVGPERIPGLAGDPILDALVPVEEESGELEAPAEGWPPPRRSHLLGLRSGRREAVEGVADAPGWTELVAAHLAARLHRLEASSLGYLRDQFLARPGTVTRGPEELRVVLDGLPLSVVLRMSGMLGDRGPLPWDGGRRLVVVLAGG